MWQKKQTLRFRIPWLHPKQISNSCSKSDTNTKASIQKPPFGYPIERKMVSATQKDMKIVSSVDPVTNNVSSPENPYPQASVVTLAGENKGAIMHIGSSSKKESSIPIHRAYKTNQTEETTTDEDENSCEDSIDKTFVNSNIQSMNNSMLLHGSISGRDPGVRLILQPQHSIKYLDTGNSGKGQIVNKSSYRPQPVVRRRCLRGLLLESSDSEPDNTNKPRRHGCKVPCGVTN